MKSETIERDRNLSAAYVSVCAVGAVLLVGAGASYGIRTMASVGLGSALAVSNLWALEKLVGLYLKAGGGRWAAIATVKAAILLGLVSFLVKHDVVGLLPLVAGFGALPVGVVISGLVPGPPHTEES